jgi:hypothetical protein
VTLRLRGRTLSAREPLEGTPTSSPSRRGAVDLADTTATATRPTPSSRCATADRRQPEPRRAPAGLRHRGTPEGAPSSASTSRRSASRRSRSRTTSSPSSSPSRARTCATRTATATRRVDRARLPAGHGRDRDEPGARRRRRTWW